MLRRYIFLLSIFVTGQALAARQTQPQASSRSPVHQLLTITNKGGKPVSNPKESDFKIFEEGKLQTITAFSDATNLPLSILLAVDTSGSAIDTELDKILNATVQVLQPILRTGKDKVALATFNTSGKLEQDFTDDIATLKAVLRRGIMRPGGGTSLYDALANASAYLAASKGRKIIIVISDGDDTASLTSREESIRQVIQGDVSIVAIYATLGAAPSASSLVGEARSGKQILERMTEDTGGMFFDYRELERLDNLRSALMSQYTVEFQSSNPDTNAKYRKIKIETINKDYRLRYRPGYYPGK